MELSKVVAWLNVNKLSLNVNKTHYILFTNATRPISFEFDIKMNGENVKRVSSTKFLGVIVDEHLKWHEHIKLIKNKVSKGIWLLCKGRKVLNVSTILNMYMYSTFVYPYLTYCNEFW